MKKIIVVSLWTLLALGIIASALGFTAIYNGWIGYMPPIEELQNPINRFATQVISADGKIMGTWNYNRENRIMVDYTQAHSVFERLLQKPIEWVIAVKLERNYTKDEIIAMYLNYFDFLHNAVGIKTASNTYFSKDPKDLKVTEAAVLIGLCKNPSYFNPVRHPERSLERRNVVLHQMVKAGYLSEEEYDKYSAPMWLTIKTAWLCISVISCVAT